MSNIYMRVKGAAGNASTKNYDGWIRLLSVSHGVMRFASMKVGNMSDRRIGVPQFKELRIKKILDAASNDLFMKSVAGKASAEVEIHVCRGVDNEPYYKLLLNDVIFTRLRTRAFSGLVPFESLDLYFAKIEQTYIGSDKAGKALSPSRVGYDLAAAEIL